MNNQTVFKFKVFFGDDAQERYVVAKTEDEALEKLEAYFADLAASGFATPTCIADYPTVDNYCVIV